jgi:hypothetical protein
LKWIVSLLKKIASMVRNAVEGDYADGTGKK